jgi:hypothetical protein
LYVMEGGFQEFLMNRKYYLFEMEPSEGQIEVINRPGSLHFRQVVPRDESPLGALIVTYEEIPGKQEATEAEIKTWLEFHGLSWEAVEDADIPLPIPLPDEPDPVDPEEPPPGEDEDPQTPDEPSGIVLAISHNSVLSTWQEPDQEDVDVAGARTRWTGSEWTPWVLAFQVPSQELEALDVGLEPETTYRYRFQARDLSTGLNSVWSASVEAVTLEEPEPEPEEPEPEDPVDPDPPEPEPDPPPTPSGFSLTTISHSEIRVDWTSPSESGINIAVARSRWTGSAWGSWGTQAEVPSTDLTITDTGLVDDTLYRYRLQSRDTSTGLNSNWTSPLEIRTLEDEPDPDPVPPSTRPYDPGYSTIFCIHDFSSAPTEAGEVIATSGGGRMQLWNYGGFEASAERNYIGGGDQEGKTGIVDASVTEVTHGSQAPHGKSKVWRHRLPAGMGTTSGTASGNGGGMDFFATDAKNLQFRELYETYWIIYEGHDYNGQRVLQDGGYRMTREVGADRRQNHYSMMRSSPLGGSRRRSAITGECTDAGRSAIEDPNEEGYSPVTAITPNFKALPTVSNNSDAPHCSGNQQNDYSNWLTGGVRGWTLGLTGNRCNSSGSTFPGCVIQVGRWYRVTRLMKLGTPDTPDGSFQVWIHDDQMNEVGHAKLENIRMLSSVWSGESGYGFPNKGFIFKTLWSHFHPEGGPQKPYEDYVSIANLYMTGVLMDEDAPDPPPPEPDPDPEDPDLPAPGQPQFEAHEDEGAIVTWTESEGADDYAVKSPYPTLIVEGLSVHIPQLEPGDWVCIYPRKNGVEGPAWRCNTWVVEEDPDPDPGDPPPPGEGDRPNEPEGFTVIGDNDGSVVGGIRGTETQGQPAFGINGFGDWWEFNNVPPKVELVDDSSNPTGSGKAIELTISANGVGAITTAQSLDGKLWDEIYISTRFYLVPSHWDDGGSGNKLFYMNTTGQNVSRHFIGRPNNTLPNQMQHIGHNAHPNGGIIWDQWGVWRQDRWLNLEFYWKRESQGGAGDGISRAWLDGELIANATNVPWAASGQDPRFGVFQWYAHFSTSGGGPRNGSSIYRVGELYISGKEETEPDPVDPPPEPVDERPNEPSEMTEIVIEHDCSYVPSERNQQLSHHGQVNGTPFSFGGSSLWNSVNATGAHGKDQEWLTEFNPGMAWSGNGYFDIRNSGTEKNYRRWYIHYWYRIEGPDGMIENPFNLLRMMYIGNQHHRSRFGLFQNIWWSKQNGNCQLELSLLPAKYARFMFGYRNYETDGCSHLGQYSPECSLEVQKWYRIEIDWFLGNLNSANGFRHIWVTDESGEEVWSHSRTGIRYLGSNVSTTVCDTQDRGFSRIRLAQIYNNPGWGGTLAGANTGTSLQGAIGTIPGYRPILGSGGSNEYWAQGVDPGSRFVTVAFNVRKVGNPTDGLTLRVHSSPGGSVEKSITFPNPSEGWNYHNFLENLVSTVGSTFYISVVRTGSRNTSNYYEVAESDQSGDYSGGTAFQVSNGSWSVDSSRDLLFAWNVKTRSDYTRFADFYVSGIPQ